MYPVTDEPFKSAILLWSALQSRRRFFTPYTAVAALTEVLLDCGAILSAITIYASHPLLLNALLIVPASLILLCNPRARPHDRLIRKAKKADRDDAATGNSASESPLDPLPIKPFVTAYRGGLLIITAAAILAVDFRAFPRRFAKVETWGTSLMDMGVGAFVFSGGVAGARSLLKEKQQSNHRQNLPNSTLRSLLQSLRHAAPLVALGAVRVASTKGVDYAEHVTEYGVHWNFYFTLALLAPGVALLRVLHRAIPSYAVLALLLSAAHEVALDFTGLTAFIIAAPRDSLLEQNREGLFSFVGYLAICLAGQATGLSILPREAKPANTRDKDGTRVPALRAFARSALGRLLLWTALWTALYALTTSYHGFNLTVSRRLANLPYVLWVCAFNCGQLALLAAIERLCFGDLYVGGGGEGATAVEAEAEKRRCREATSTVLHAFNRNGLPLFLLANVFTGAVNLSLPTLDMGTAATMGVLGAYMGLLAAVALGLERSGVVIKL